ncbi:TatD family hydrolase [Acidithiobacillus thiooxidans]|uniref:TatD family hydrolase n=1 Tax=Acidithiobacillus thiooxidans TaxID=930 RepID=UPI00285C4BC9|nr:TatD family hydrolase [Acidithiobacillus thiooxidans]MDR7927044.1 TatD family hydrolase [Acidithiobacillus thiooxidans]
MDQILSASNDSPGDTTQNRFLYGLVDSHCHLDDEAFAPDRSAVMQRARNAGVDKILVPAYSPVFWPRLQEVCAQQAMLYPAYGVHPLYIKACGSNWLEQLRSQLDGAVAVGEIGLDLSDNAPDYALQVAYLKMQLHIAQELNLPVILHARRTLEQLSQVLRDFPSLRGVVHSFSGSLVQAQRLVDRGFYLSLSGAFTHARALRLQATIKSLPVDRILVETDAPWQAAESYRGQRNEPGFLVKTVYALAHLLQARPQLLAEQLTRNTLALFHFQEKL